MPGNLRAAYISNVPMKENETLTPLQRERGGSTPEAKG